MDPIHQSKATEVEMDLNGCADDLLRPFVRLPDLGVLSVLCGYPYTAGI
jgi:hypothetical protein